MPKLKIEYLVIVGLTLLFLWLPSSNSGIDAYAYASAIKWGHELIWPHHLLYCLTGRIVFLGLNAIYPQDALAMMKALNAITAGFCLFILYKILVEIKALKPLYYLIFIASCFGFMRFATENETYILPILFDLGGTFFFIKYLKYLKNSYVLASGLFFGIAVLFHQIHIFWYVGFGIAMLFYKDTFKLKNILAFILSGAILVAAVYLFIYQFSETFSEESILRFVLHDFYTGHARTSIGLNNFMMTPISFVRTFIQVHGYMWPLLKSNPVLWLVPIVFLLVLMISFKTIYKYSFVPEAEFNILRKAALWTFLLQFAFAFYSVGNAEFMAMLPFLLVLVLVTWRTFPPKPVFYISLVLLFWNLVFGISPLHFLDLSGSKQLLAKLESQANEKWLLNEPQKMENMYDYFHGVDASKGIIFKPINKDTIQINLIRNLASEGVLTNCISGKQNFGRQNLIFSSQDLMGIFNEFNHSPVDSLEFFGGKTVIERLSVK